jgi:hypothetical protein
METPDQPEPVMPAPKPGKHPLKTNVYFQARHSNTQLAPLFPYEGPGDIVPCCSSFRSFPGGPRIGFFQHANTVDEVFVSFGSTGESRSGDVFVGAKKHAVGGWGTTEEFYGVLAVTQRQLEEGTQPEAIIIACEKCGAEMVNHEFGISGAEHERGAFPPLQTIRGSAHAASLFNASEQSRTCPSCGHLNEPFPTYIWGWDRYMFNTGIVEQSRVALEEAARK